MLPANLMMHCTVLLFSLLLITPAIADDDSSAVVIKTIKAAGNVYMLTGQGGNIGLSVGNDGVFLVDDQFAPLTVRILAAIEKLSDKPVRFLLNTHWHPDHTGGNENLGRGNTVIVAHNNVRKRLSVDNYIEMFQMDAPALDPAGLPVITFNDSLTFHLNGDDITALHVENAHTDGDAIVHFRQANVIHAGDTYFAGMYPFIDTASGGSACGMIDAVEQILALANEQTVIIPGHGPISNKRKLIAWHRMLKTITDRIQTLVDEGASLDQVQASLPTRSYDDEYGGGYIKSKTFVEMLYKDMSLDRS